MISLLIEGAFMRTEDINIINQLTGYSALEAGGIMAIPKLGWGFMTHGLPKILLWDYAFLEGAGFEILRWILMPLSIAVVWGIVQTFIGIAQGLLGRFL